MKKIILFFACFACLLVFPFMFLTGCSLTTEGNAYYNDDFVLLSVSRFGVDSESFIVYHKETKVMYFFCKIGDGGGLSVMLNSDGTPMIYEGD